MPRHPDLAADLGLVLGPGTEAVGGLRGAVTLRWFEGLAAGVVAPNEASVVRFLEELYEVEER